MVSKSCVEWLFVCTCRYLYWICRTTYGIYQEVEANHQIQIIKGANNVTEQRIDFVINLALTAPDGLEIATLSADGEDNDFFFPSAILLSIEPEENITFADLLIFEDDLPEIFEGALLRLSLPDADALRFETLPQYPEFYIIIRDDDDREL